MTQPRDDGAGAQFIVIGLSIVVATGTMLFLRDAGRDWLRDVDLRVQPPIWYQFPGFVFAGIGAGVNVLVIGRAWVFFLRVEGVVHQWLCDREELRHAAIMQRVNAEREAGRPTRRWG